MLRISLAGYLGNQLFQLAFAHQVVREYKVKRIQLFNFTGDPSNSENFLDKNDIRCKNIKYSINPSLARTRVKAFNKLRSFKFSSENRAAFITKVYDTTYLNYVEQELKSNSILLGYFQDVRKIPSGVLDVLYELSDLLEESFESIPEFIKIQLTKLGEYQVLHVRRNDFTAEGNENFGILHADYYLKHLSKDLPVIVTTDDHENIDDIKNAINVSLILGSNDLSPLQALALMSHAKVLVAANSTLSFWGGLFCFKSNGTTYFPPTKLANSDFYDASIIFPKFILTQGIFR